MSFSERIASLKRDLCENMDAPTMAIFQRATVELRKSGILQQCLQVGETTPNFTFTDSNQVTSSLYSLLEKSPVLINFFRGFWCNFCKTELDAYAEIQTALEKSGIHCLHISPNRIDNDELPAALTTKASVIHDVDNQIAHQFGIVYTLNDQLKTLFSSWEMSLADLHQSEQWELPIPASYIIDQNRKAIFCYAEADYTKRIDPTELLEFNKSL